MIVTVEISMYPLVDQYESAIIPFIQGLKKHDDLKVKTNAMSTYIQGEFEVVWDALKVEFGKSFATNIPMSNVIKIIPRDLPIDEGWLVL